MNQKIADIVRKAESEIFNQTGKRVMLHCTDLLRRPIATNKTVSVDVLQRAVCRHFEIKLSDLRGCSRLQRIKVARFCFTYILHAVIRTHTLSEIGGLIGNRDHSTIINANKKYVDWLKTDKYFANTSLQAICKALNITAI